MGLSSLGKAVAKYAPLLGAILPIPGGAALGTVIASLFGGSLDDVDDLIKRINKDPDAALKLAQFEMQHKVELERIALQQFQAEVADKASARARELEITKATGQIDTTIRNLAYFTTMGFFAVLLLLFMPDLDISEHEKNLILILLGMLASKWQTVIDYFFGASQRKA